MVSEDEQAHWRTWASYGQSFGSVARIESQFELGSANDRFQNELRIHDFSLVFSLKSHSLRLGRIAHFSALIQARVDGGEYILNTKRFGSVKILGGSPADIDLRAGSPTEKGFFLASWGAGGLNRNLTVSYWSRGNEDNTTSYAGVNWRIRLPTRGGVSGSFAWDLSHGELYYSRVLVTQRLGGHRLTLGFRNKRYVQSGPYTWVDRKVSIPPAVTVGVTSSLPHDISWWNEFVYRIGETSTQYLRSNLVYKNYQATFLAGTQGERRLIGGGLGTTRKLLPSLSVGGNVMINAIDYGELMEMRSAKAIYGWIAWQPNSRIMVKLYGQFHQNPYFTIDGRGGVAVRVAF